MVFESIISPKSAERRPYEMLFIGALYAVAAISVSMLLFMEYASLISIFLIVLMSSVIVYRTIQMEERKDFNFSSERRLLREHSKALAVFTFLFLGIALAVSVFYIALPDSISHMVFSVQESTIGQITGNAINPGMALMDIFLSNMKILVICLAFAFLFGFGAIFILAWNASVMGVVIGAFVKTAAGGTYMMAYPLGLLRYLIHGIPEIIAYFMAGLAAGIISVAIIRHDWRSKKFYHVINDSADLLALSIAVLFIAAMIEVFVTPAFF
jgi:stage II sporulation protein M